MVECYWLCTATWPCSDERHRWCEVRVQVWPCLDPGVALRVGWAESVHFIPRKITENDKAWRRMRSAALQSRYTKQNSPPPESWHILASRGQCHGAHDDGLGSHQVRPSRFSQQLRKGLPWKGDTWSFPFLVFIIRFLFFKICFQVCFERVM